MISSAGSLLGRIATVKMKILPHINYFFSMLPIIPKGNWFKSINSITTYYTGKNILQYIALYCKMNPPTLQYLMVRPRTALLPKHHTLRSAISKYNHQTTPLLQKHSNLYNSDGLVESHQDLQIHSSTM